MVAKYSLEVASPAAAFGTTTEPATMRGHEDIMDIDKVDEITQALLYLTTHKDKYGPPRRIAER